MFPLVSDPVHPEHAYPIPEEKEIGTIRCLSEIYIIMYIVVKLLYSNDLRDFTVYITFREVWF